MKNTSSTARQRHGSFGASASTSKKASSFPSWGRPAPASRRCFTCSACTTAPGPANFTSLDHPIHKLNKKDRSEIQKKYIGFVFQSYHLLDSLTVYENLDMPLSYRNIKKAERDSIVCDMLDRFQMVGKKDLFPNQLSGGQQQLVAVARALVASPKLILADEPTGNLHSSQAKEIMELFKRLNDEGITDRAGDALGDERLVRPPRHRNRRRLDYASVNVRLCARDSHKRTAPKLFVLQDQRFIAGSDRACCSP